MMSKLTRLRDEATRLLTVYQEHQHSDDAEMRRKAHIDVDRFLMENRETAMILLVQGLQQEVDELLAATKVQSSARSSISPGWLSRMIQRRKVTTSSTD